MQRSTKWIILGALVVSTMTGCEKIEALTGGRRSSGDIPSETDTKTKKPNIIVDADGTTRLGGPSVIEQREGKSVSSTTLATGGASAAGPADSWLYKKAKGPGYFLVSAASHPNTVGGDMIRRINLSGSIKEFDYDKKTEGAQGAYILVPDAMREAVPAKYIDGDGLFSGIICGFIPGPDKTIIALANGSEGGVAFLLDPYEEAPAFTPLQAIRFPFATNTCRGIFSQDLNKIYVVDVARTNAKNGQEGIFVADILKTDEPTIASFYVFDQKDRINSHSVNNFQSLTLFNDNLYLISGNGRFDGEWDNVIYTVPLNDLGEPLFEKVKHTRTQNPTVMTPGCGINDANIADVMVVDTAKGPRLLSTGTRATIAWDISGDALVKVDMDPDRPGIQGLNIEKMGRGGTRLLPTVNGKEIIQLTHCRSEKTSVKIDNDYDMLAFDLPVFEAKDLSLGKAIDAGYREVLKSLKKASYRPQFSMDFGDMAVGTKHIAVIGNSGADKSGLSAGGDVVIIDLSKRSNIGFTKPSDMRRAHEYRYGFKLAQGDSAFENVEQRSHAVIWIP